MDFRYPQDLSISSYVSEIGDLIKDNQVVIIAGETGSGKTTQIPKICLQTFPELHGIIGCTQPRRIAATSVSARVKEELGDQQSLVSYKIRFQDKTRDDTRIKFMTDGVLLAETRHDPLLRKYGVIIIDEAHERSLNIDFLLGYLHTLIAKRNELKLIITSATIDTATFSKHFQNAPILSVSGRTYPVDLIYAPPDNSVEELNYLEHCVDVIAEICDHQPPGDILVFLPTERDITNCSEILQGRLPNHITLKLFGRLQQSDQQRIFKNYHKPKIVLATNVAETSLTVPGIRYVVDTGLARISTYNPRFRTTTLPVTRISQASCNQRSGRCGRVGPGICFRLFSEEDFLSRPEYTIPEIHRVNLAEVILQMVALKLGDPFDFPFLTPPQPAAIHDGYRMLQELGAITKAKDLTKYGKMMSRLPIDPVISRIIIEADKNNCVRDIAIIASVLAIQDPRVRPADKEQLADEAHKTFAHPQSDFLVLLNIWDSFHSMAKGFSWSRLKRFCARNFLSFQRMREWIDLHEQLTRILNREKQIHFAHNESSYDAIHQSLLSGFFRQCARRKKGSVYQDSSNREIMIFPGSQQFTKSGDWIVAGSFIETSRLFAHTVATIEPEWIEQCAKPFCSYSWSNIRWEKKSGRVVADETVSLHGLVILAGRTVNFPRRHKKNISAARTVFIQKALLEGSVNESFAFLKQNRNLIKKWQSAEHKLRKKNIVIEESTIFDFYDSKLPSVVYDLSTLKGYLKKAENDLLVMAEKDILLRTPANKELADYPTSLIYGSTTITLSYRFEPGNESDGVTAHIPEYIVDTLKADYFEWLVPGLLVEKTTFLVKGLPKKIRKHLIPINTTVERILDSLVLYRGNYYKSLSETLFKMYKITIHASDWPKTVPAHLQMRFIVKDSSGRELISSRDFSKLQKEFVSSPRKEAHYKIRKKEQDLIDHYKNRIFTDWDFTDIPKHIPVYGDKNDIVGYLYPALRVHPQKNGVTVSFEKTQKVARRINRAGTHHLLLLQFKEQYKRLKKYCGVTLSGPSTVWLTSLLGKRETVSELLLGLIIGEVFESDREPIIDKKRYDQIVTQVAHQGLFKRGQIIIDKIMAILRLRKDLYATINRYAQLSDKSGNKNQVLFSELHNQLNEIIPGNFLEKYTINDLDSIPRYLKSLAIRTERAYANPHKDQQKQAKILPHQENLKMLKKLVGDASDDCRERFKNYEHAVAEYRISLFSPEIKTATGVSEKKITHLWQDIRRSC